MSIFVVHYGEIGLKGKNRARFQRALIKNLKERIKGKIKMDFSSIIVETNMDRDFVESTLRFTPGIEKFSLAKVVDPKIESIRDACASMIKNERTFRITTKRQNKKFPMSSQEINKVVGEFVRREKKVNVRLKGADTEIFIEICKRCYIYSKKDVRPGIGGLPVGSSGKVVSLVSGGIDSAVASFLMMKRGCKVILLHFFNERGGTGMKDKILRIAERLSFVQGKTKLYLFPFGELQAEIISKVPAELRMIVYKIEMLRIANMVAGKEGAGGIVCGDSLAQVASQTLENISVIYRYSDLPVLSPLIGMDKKEIVNLAKFIGTYEISILPYDDCCSFMVARHPETRARADVIEKFIKLIDEKVVENCANNAQIYVF